MANPLQKGAYLVAKIELDFGSKGSIAKGHRTLIEPIVRKIGSGGPQIAGFVWWESQFLGFKLTKGNHHAEIIKEGHYSQSEEGA